MKSKNDSIDIPQAKEIKKYLAEISKLDLITSEDESILAKRIKKGDDKALEILVRSNLRFVVSVAKQYQNQGLSLPDLINEGNLGLIKAAKKFDETKGFKFISYGVWWIRQSILQALAEQSKIVRLPLRSGSRSKIGVVQVELSVFLFKEGDVFNCFCPELDLVGYDYTETKAKKSFEVVLSEFLVYTQEHGTLVSELKKMGWKVTDQKPFYTSPDIAYLVNHNEDFRRILNEFPSVCKRKHPTLIPYF